MRKLAACALAFGVFAVSAQAADSGGGLKDPLPDTLTSHGVTVYGAIDLAYAYQTNGAPLSTAFYTGLQYNMFGSRSSRKQISSITNNALSQSFIGVKIEEALGGGWTAIGNLDTGFNPVGGELSDACASLARNNGKALAEQNTAADGSRCGQFLNGQAYGGVSNATFGTLTAGRQNTLDLDLMTKYDPMAMSYAFSLIGYSGSAGPGVGDTESARWDNSVKYTYQYGPVHAAGMYALGGQDTALHSDGWAANAGATLWGISADVVYTKENSVISGASLSAAQVAALGTPPLRGFSIDKSLAGTISDNTAWTVGAKYTFDFGAHGGLKDGGYKDDCCCTGSADDPWWCGKLTLFGGYQHIQFNDPTDLVNVGDTTIGGYRLPFVNNTNFFTSRILQVAWAGAKYELPSGWSVTGAYYHADQNTWINSTGTCAFNTATNIRTGAAGFKTGSNCAGNFNMGSFLADYAFNKHFDVYAGVNYSVVDGGLESGFLADESFLFVTGARLKF
jgi:predicted porin